MKKELKSMLGKAGNIAMSAMLAVTLMMPSIPAFASDQEGAAPAEQASVAAIDAPAADDDASAAAPAADVAVEPAAAAVEEPAAAEPVAEQAAADVAASEEQPTANAPPAAEQTAAAVEQAAEEPAAAADAKDEAAEPVIEKGPNGLAGLDLSDDSTVVPTPLGDLTMAEVRAYAAARDARRAASQDSGLSLLSVGEDSELSLLSNSDGWSYSGWCYTEFWNRSVYDNVFTVTIDGSDYTGYCLDEGLPACEDGWYQFTATWDPDNNGYLVTVDCSGGDVHWNQYDTGEGCQEIGDFYVYMSGSFELTKTIDSSYGISVGGLYKVDGAVYGLYYYRTAAEAKDTPNAYLTIGADGKSNTVTGLEPGDGNWYVRELTAPDGCMLDNEIHAVQVAPSNYGTSKATVSDKAILDPKGVLLKKVKASGETYYGEDGKQVGVAGAVYQFAYYDTLFYDEASIPAMPTRVWHLTTNANGFVGLQYGDTSKAQGYRNDEFYRDAESNVIAIPYGTLVIKEVASPDGYKLSSDVFIATMRPADNGDKLEWVWNRSQISGTTATAEEATDTGSLIIKKVSSDPSISQGNSNYTLAGAKFEVYNNASCSGDPIATVTTDADGKTPVIEKLAPYGTFYVKEIKAPNGFELPAEGNRVQEVTVLPGEMGVTTFEYSDKPITGNGGAIKASAQARTNGNANYSVAGAKFGFWVNDATCTGDPDYTRVTKADGTTEPITGLAIGTVLTVKEIEAPANFKLYSGTKSVTIVGNQTVTVTFEDEPYTGTGRLIKRAADATTDITDGNAMYSLEGAVYGVYTDVACTNKVYELTTDATGKTNAFEDLLIGSTYYIKEIKASEGFKTDTNVYTMNITSYTQEAVVEVEEAPVYAPANIALDKVDADGKAPEGDATFEGAEYTFSFYAGKTAASGTPDAVWVIKTDANGHVSLADADDASRLVSHTGKEWRVGGKLMLPLGTLTVHETKAPVGYYLSDKTYTNTLVYDATAESAVWAAGGDFSDTSVIKDPEKAKKFGISVYKEIQGVPNETSPEGIEFEIYLVAEDGTETLKETLVLDANGKASTAADAFYLGTYKVYEVESTLPVDADGNYLIQPYSHTSGMGSNLIATVEQKDDATYTDMKVIDVSCVDYTSETIEGEKKDKDTGEVIANTEFTLYRYTGELGMDDGVIETNPASLDAHGSYWEVVSIVTTDSHGKFDFGNQLYGIYMVAETCPEWHYMGNAESAAGGVEADPLETARIFTIDKSHEFDMQLWEDVAIQIECNVDKSTIEVTSAGLVSKTKSEEGEDLTNVGIENYKYEVSFDNGATNTYADEYWVVDEFNMVASPYDLRVIKIVLPTVTNDTNAGCYVLYRTNKGAEGWDPVVEAASAHANTLCDGTSRFDGSAWTCLGYYADGSAIDVTAMGLADGEYLTGLCLYYGAVEQGFKSTAPLQYLVTATHELREGITIPNTATSHITRNWADRGGSEDGLSDDDTDSVQTIVIGTFEIKFEYKILGSGYGSIGAWLPQTGDDMGNLAILALGLLVVSGGALICLRRRMKMEGDRNE